VRCFRHICLIIIFFAVIVISVRAEKVSVNDQNRSTLNNIQVNSFTQKDRERLIRLEIALLGFIKNVDENFYLINKHLGKADGECADLRSDIKKQFDYMAKILMIISVVLIVIVIINIFIICRNKKN
jgi:cell division protein FtsL